MKAKARFMALSSRSGARRSRQSRGAAAFRAPAQRTWALAALGAALLVLAFGASAAHAQIGVVSEIGEAGSGNGQLMKPGALAVNQSTGDLYVVDRGNRRIDVFGSSGVFQRAWGWDVDAENPGTEFEICVAPSTCKAGLAGGGEGEIGRYVAVGLQEYNYYPASIAIDQSSGDVYLTDPENAGRVEHFDAQGHYLGLMPFHAHYVQIDAAGNFYAYLDNTVTKYGPAGAALATITRFSGFTSYYADNVFGARFGLDAQADLYALESQSKTPKILKFSSADESLAPFAPAETEGRDFKMLAVQPLSGDVYVYQRQTADRNGYYELARYSGAGALLEEQGLGMPEPEGSEHHHIASVQLYNGLALDGPDAYLSDEFGTILKFGELSSLPTASISAPTELTGESAVLHGTVNPNGGSTSTSYQFQYRERGAPQWTVLPGPNLGSGSTEVPVSAPLGELNANTTYEVRLIAAREMGEGSATSSLEFTTKAVPPTLSEVGIAHVTDTSAELWGHVNPRNAQTTYYFEYGTSNTYGISVPVGQDGNAGAGVRPVQVGRLIEGLQPETTYHYRLVATNAAGPVEEQDQTFTTRSSAEAALPSRDIELVNNPDTGNQIPRGYLSADGSHVLWTTLTGAPGGTTGNGSPFVAHRTSTGWVSQSLFPPLSEVYGQGALPFFGPLATPDFSHLVLFTAQDGPAADSLTIVDQDGIGAAQRPIWIGSPAPDQGYEQPIEGSLTGPPDLSHLIGLTIEPIDPEHPVGSEQLYDFATDPPTLVSRVPNGHVARCGLSVQAASENFLANTYDWVSTSAAHDGTRVFFESRGVNCSGPVELYMRDIEAGTASLVSGPPVSGPDKGGTFVRASADGSEAVFFSESKLSQADLNSDVDIYRWRLEGGPECLTCIVEDANVVMGRGGRSAIVSQNLDYVYFSSTLQLVPGKGKAGRTNLYVVHEGGLHFIAATNPKEETGPTAEALLMPREGKLAMGAEVSDDGSKLFFESESSGLTPDDPGGSLQTYRYDADSGFLECITCPPPGIPTAKVTSVLNQGVDVFTGLTGYAQQQHLASADGATYVFATSVPLVRNDINGTFDVYEWHNGRLGLITDGTTESSSGESRPVPIAISADGTNVLFRAVGRLTDQVVDDTPNLFVARRGGQLPPTLRPPAPCVEDACQGPLAPQPPYETPASSGANGPGNLPPSNGRRGKHRHNRHRGRHHTKAHHQKTAHRRNNGGQR